MANESLTEALKIKREVYLDDFLTYLSFQIDRGEVMEEEDKYQDLIRKQRKGRG